MTPGFPARENLRADLLRADLLRADLLRADLLRADIDEAARIVAPLWPLGAAIAVNPLWDLRHLPFDQAIAYAREILHVRGYPPATAFGARAAPDSPPETPREGGPGIPAGTVGREPSWAVETPSERYDRLAGTGLAAALDRMVASFCAAYVAGVLEAVRSEGLYAAWLAVAPRDPRIRRLGGRAGCHLISRLGDTPIDAIHRSLVLLGVNEADRVSVLARHLARQPGWAGHAKWRSASRRPTDRLPALHLVDYLAVRLATEAVLLAGATPLPSGPAPPRTPFLARPSREPGAGRRGAVGEGRDRPAGTTSRPPVGREALIAHERRYRDGLLATLSLLPTPARRPVDPDAQVLFCIDPRSEGARRRLEEAGPYETFGVAGFFSLPLRYRHFGSADEVELCPAILTPTRRVAEIPAPGAARPAGRRLRRRQTLEAAHAAYKGARDDPVGTFALAEMAGFLTAPITLTKTLAPGPARRLAERLRHALAPDRFVTFDLATLDSEGDDEEWGDLAWTLLTSAGLTHDFAPLVVFCGHGSATENNPYASALDCGACGGQRGGNAARVAAAVLGRPGVRRHLARRGIHIPARTTFAAAEHNTATGTLHLLDHHLLPSDAAEQATALVRSFAEASGPGRRRPRRVAEPADWAQLRPEWALAGNAALIVGPRHLTAGRDLGGRCFLHSYDTANDPDGRVLEAILLGPLIVAHWINAQYYFSSVDPEILGAGDKSVHNVLAGVGVVSGRDGDLAVGLPVQSLFVHPTDTRPVHEPLRLLAVVAAPIDRLETVIARQELLRQLFDGEWVHLAAGGPDEGGWSLRAPGGHWQAWSADRAQGSASPRGATRSDPAG
jgi:uncharacterized protein YbcC (UPF0753/DUF2309 family)